MRPTLELWIVGCVLIWFCIKGVFLATTMPPGGGPDEIYHLQVIELFRTSPYWFPFLESDHPFSPPSEKFVRFGNQTELSHLYHAGLSGLSRVLNIDPYLFLSIQIFRAINLLISLLTLFVFYRTTQFFFETAQGRILSLVLHSSVLTFTILASSVSYDPVVNLLATLSILCLVKFIHSRDWYFGYLWASGLCVALAFKLVVAPLVLAGLATLVGVGWSLSRGSIGNSVGFKFPARSWTEKCLLVVTFISASLSLLYISIPLFKYGTLMPSCQAIYGATACEGYENVSGIPLVQHAEAKSLFAYMPYWLFHSVSSSLGVRNCVGVAAPFPLVVIGVIAILGAILLGFLKFRKDSPHWRMALVLVLVQGTVLLVLYGYPNYLRFHNYEVGMNGRYLFPVLGPVALLIARLMLLLLARIRRISYSWIICGALLLFEFPLFVLSSAGRNFLSPWPMEYYRALPYFPNPIYDKDFKLIEAPDRE